LGLGDALPLALLDERPLEFHHGSDDLQLEPLERIVLTGEGRRSLRNWTVTPLPVSCPRRRRRSWRLRANLSMEWTAVALAHVVQAG